MTQKELSTENSCFATGIDTSDEVLPSPELARELILDAYLDSLAHDESWAQPSADRRRLALEHILKKLSSLEIIGKEYVEGYFRHQYRSHFQSNTLRSTYNCLVPFLRFIKGRGKRVIEEVDKGDLEAFIEREQDRGLKVSTVKLRLAQAKAFLRYMVNEGVLKEDVFPWKLKIKVPETLPRAMDPDDVERLLEVKGSVRDRAMVLVLLRTGMRIGELLDTRVSDVYMEEQKILIYEGAKNQRGRVVYFSEDAKEALKAWMHTRDRRTELLFYGYKGKSLSYAAARMMFMRYLDRAELSHKGYTLHCLRHTYATELLNARMPLECLEKLLGHTHLEATRRYARLRDKTKEEEYFKAMAIIERRERDGYYECDRELQTILETTQLLPPHGEELHEHP